LKGGCNDFGFTPFFFFSRPLSNNVSFNGGFYLKILSCPPPLPFGGGSQKILTPQKIVPLYMIENAVHCIPISAAVTEKIGVALFFTNTL